MGDTDSPGSHSAKRVRDESGDESPDAKRLRAADRILLDILEEVDSGDRDSGDLATVMKIFEEEISVMSPCPQQQQQEEGLAVEGAAQISAPTVADYDDPGHSDLGYLLEASDDDLGLPPTLPPSSDEGEGFDGDAGEEGDRGLVELGQLWGLEDQAPGCYDELGFGGFAQDDGVAGADDVVAFDGALFDYPDVAPSGPSDYSDFQWRPESLPAV